MKKYKRPLVAMAIATATACFQVSVASAAELRFSGFLNVIGKQHNADGMRYLDTVHDTFGFNNTKFGLNVVAAMDNNFTVAAQLVGGSHNGKDVSLDWAFATYDFNDESKVKMGIIKNPNNLYSETVDVGYLYPWIRPPESVYSESAELFFETYKGAAYQFTTGDDVEFSVEAYYGNTSEEDRGEVVESHSQMAGLVFSASNEIGQIKLGYNTSILSSVNMSIPAPVAGRDGKRYSIVSLGAESNLGNVQIIAEIAHSTLEDSSKVDDLGWFATVAYAIGPWKPHVTFQQFAVDDGSVEQSSVTLGVNRRVGNNAVLKLEVQRVYDIKGNGFFEDHQLGTTNLPEGSSVNMLNASLNIIF